MMRFFPEELRTLPRAHLEPLAQAVRSYLEDIEAAIASKPPEPTPLPKPRAPHNREQRGLGARPAADDMELLLREDRVHESDGA